MRWNIADVLACAGLDVVVSSFPLGDKGRLIPCCFPFGRGLLSVPFLRSVRVLLSISLSFNFPKPEPGTENHARWVLLAIVVPFPAVSFGFRLGFCVLKRKERKAPFSVPGTSARVPVSVSGSAFEAPRQTEVPARKETETYLGHCCRKWEP